MFEAFGVDKQNAPWFRNCVLCALAILGSFSICVFNPETSLTRTDVFDYRDNSSAERQRGVTGNSVIGYGLLGLSGVIAFLASPRCRRTEWWVLAAVAGYLLLCYGSLAWTTERSLTIRKLGVATFGITAAFGYARLVGLRGIALVCVIAAGGEMLGGVLAELKNGTFRPWIRGYAFLGLLDKNGQALWASFFVLPLLILWMKGKTRTYALAAVAFGMLILILTNSRTALAACVVSSMTGLFLKSSRSLKMYLAAAALLAAGGLMLLIGTVGGEGVSKLAAMGRTEHIGKLTGRVPLWHYILGDVVDRPILGHGYYAYWSVKKIDEISSTFFWQAHQAHSIYVDLLAGLGVVGLLSFVGMVIAGLIGALHKYNKTGDPAYLFAMSVFVMTLVNGFAESKFIGFNLSGVMLFACLFGVIYETGAAPSPQNQAGGHGVSRGRRPLRLGLPAGDASPQALAVNPTDSLWRREDLP